MDVAFPFPFKPYDIQEKFMKELYVTLENQKLGIFESPTGTVSLRCSSLPPNSLRTSSEFWFYYSIQLSLFVLLNFHCQSVWQTLSLLTIYEYIVNIYVYGLFI